MKMQEQKQKQDTMFFKFLKCKNKKQNKCFLNFLFIKQELEKTKHKLSKSKPNKTNFQAQTSTMLPNLIRLTIARSIKAKEDLKTQPLSLDK